jgi:carboxylesterase type B
MFLASRKAGIGKAFSEFMQNAFSAESAAVETALNSYGIKPTTSDDEAFLHVLQFGTDIAFLAPVRSYANAWPGNAYVYHFNEPNPWDGPWKGQTGHVLDVSFLFMNFEEALTAEQKTVGEAFAENFLKLFNGIEAWPSFKQDKPSALIIGASDKSRGPAYVAESLDPKETGRRQEIYAFSQAVGLDAIIDAWNAFKG